MKYLFFALLFLNFGSDAYAQNNMGLNYPDSLRQEGMLDEAIKAYQLEYQQNPENINNLYNYTCALALSNNRDSAFKYLVIYSSKDISVAPLTDPDFIFLREDKRWIEYENKLLELFMKKNNLSIKDSSYAKQLWKMRVTDQAFYYEIDLAQKKFGKNSSVEMALWQLKKKLNDENQILLAQLIKERGWPMTSELGASASGAAFLVIQHADIDMQKKYLPMLKKRCEENEARWDAYALMYDRIEMRENRPQRYGSQISYNNKTEKYEIYKLENPEKVDAWRNEVGLGPLADYVSNWDIVFNIKQIK
jgi:hypothetical protein